ncbi:ATP-dependent DNA helicase RecG [Candidatus Kryptobacter tengchongensis]|uniref:ATP-dependent DNA helicase RecG n=2 Tax=Kryptobacter tengchongensis TaxID=1643429 RepID=A0A916LIT0_KRYT1|nr:ATP-dependent DNA helicase RecG [Candidatus Kryptobacter tengchongensis]
MSKQEKKSTLTLETDIRYLKGIGEKRSQALRDVGVEKLIDLLYYAPIKYIDRSTVVSVARLKRNWWEFSYKSSAVTFIGRVVDKKILVSSSGKEILEIVIDDGTGKLSCTWFNKIEYFKRQFDIGDLVAVFGKPVTFKGKINLVHPEFDFLTEADSINIHTGRIVPVYPSTSKLKSLGLNTLKLREMISEVINNYIDYVEETLPEKILAKYNLLPLNLAIKSIHFPETHIDLQLALKRLKFEELFFLQLLLARKHYELKHFEKGISFKKIGDLVHGFSKILPFKLTEAQRRVIREIWNDMKSDRPMNRLLQGDVGSGKTIVALIAMLIAVDNGYQSAFMAPTEILAEQHYATFLSLLDSLPVKVRLLTGSLKPKEKKEILNEIENGEAQIIIGTHALIQERVNFKNLGLVVIDEQHRFGVMQRASLIEKGYNPDVLIMTATPIPRTLAFTLYGDLDVSIIDEMPKKRKVKTEVLPDTERERVYEFIRAKLKEGHQAYIVYPLIEESEKLDLESAIENYIRLKNEVFPEFSVGLIHGKMPGTERQEIMLAFKEGKIQILVATTVIEVGIDIPNATIMVIENAERFGLAQLHQLRGRIGRGEKQSYCFLIVKSNLIRKTSNDALFEYEVNDEVKAIERVKIIASTMDGFKIAEKDLELRGPGEFFGTKQSGFIKFKFADISKDRELLELARSEAFAIIKEDPDLSKPEHSKLRKEFLKRYSDSVNLAKVS